MRRPELQTELQKALMQLCTDVVAQATARVPAVMMRTMCKNASDKLTEQLSKPFIPRLQIGKFNLSYYHDTNHLWLANEDGEGMAMPVSQMESLLDKFFADNF